PRTKDEEEYEHDSHGIGKSQKLLTSFPTLSGVLSVTSRPFAEFTSKSISVPHLCESVSIRGKF
ncbi:MAG TPA: hypothetical protein VK968_17155, partial [Roseimicrobium sp.]|nr:hypothetical protein [Roseimicrobium sp.]